MNNSSQPQLPIIPEQIRHWENRPSAKTYREVKFAINDFILGMQACYVWENENYYQSLRDEEKRYKATLDQIKAEICDAPNQKMKSEMEQQISNMKNGWHSTKTTISEAVSSQQINFRNEPRSDHRKRKDKAILENFESRKAWLQAHERKMEKALEYIVEKYNIKYELYVEINNLIYKNKANQLTVSYERTIQALETEHRRNLVRLTKYMNDVFPQYFSYNAFKRANAVIDEIMRPSKGYTCATEIPKVLFFGVRSMSISCPDDRAFYPEIVNMLNKTNPQYQYDDNETYVLTFTFPYFRTIEEGYSLFIRVNDVNTPLFSSSLGAYVRTMLMNFPAGQLRPVLVDSDSTIELTDFRAIGEYTGGRYVTRPWTDPEDIQAEMKKLSTELSNLTISYGRDIESRLVKEPIYFTACRNFPKGFTAQALENLANVFMAGASKGFFGAILANKSELEQLQKDANSNSIIENLIKSSLFVDEIDGLLSVIDDAGPDIFMHTTVSGTNQYFDDILAQIIEGTKNYSRQTEEFEYLFSKDPGNIEGTNIDDINTWFRGDASERFEVPLGISGASTVQKFTISDVAQHALISGVTGSGKSMLLKNIILSSMIRYTPDDVNLYLIDFKEGVEFVPFIEQDLPWIKAVALNTERSFALNILKKIQEEFKERAEAMKRDRINKISDSLSQKYPRILLIFDEIQELLRDNDDITKECLSILSNLVSEGRAMNINIIIASQDFRICNGIESLKTNMRIRIAMKGSRESARLIMGEDFSVVQLEQGSPGFAAINDADGAKGRTSFFQAGYIDDDTRDSIISKLSAIMSGYPSQTRIMSIYSNYDRNNKFNKLILNGITEKSDTPERYEFMLGDDFNLGIRRRYYLSPVAGDNLLLVGDNENLARSLFAFSILSILYGEAAFDAADTQNEAIRLIDMSDEYAVKGTYFKEIKSHFIQQISYADIECCDDMIIDTYELLQRRKRGLSDKSERLFLMIFGLDSISSFGMDLSGDEDDGLSVEKKLLKIIQEGPANGINSIIWTRDLMQFNKVVDGNTFVKHIKKRIYFGHDSGDAEYVLRARFDGNKLPEMSVCYRDTSKAVPSYFRAYELPENSWVTDFAAAYNKYCSNR